MKVPVFRFEEELLTDAPLDAVEARLRSFSEDPACLRRFKTVRREGERVRARVQPWFWEQDVLLDPVGREGDRLRLQWFMTPLPGLEELGGIEAWPEADRTRIWLWGRLKGWPSLLMGGAVRFVSDQSIEHFVDSL